MYHIVSRTHKGVTGVLAGFSPEPYWIDHPLYEYTRCCLFHKNWEPTGEIKQMGGAWYGYTHYAPRAKCTVCGCSMNAGFYSNGGKVDL